ncbi:MAG: energy transducer TonB [Chitinivibrionia bacterium]|nr:energy transducer TonB [Chitinivibrionia bacterium]
MRNAILISLVFHVSVYIASTQIVEFARVKYVPRQVYSVNLLSMEDIERMMQSKGASPAPQQAVQEPPEEEEKAQPPVEPPPESKKKADTKMERSAKKKQVPSSEVRNGGTGAAKGGTGTGTGSKQGGATGDMNLDVSDFPFGYYLVTIRRKIAGSWSVPQAQAGEEIFCRVYFRIARDGRIISPDIEKSSGSFMFDQSALRAVMQASPLPPLPGGFGDEYLGVHFSFAYEEN